MMNSLNSEDKDPIFKDLKDLVNKYLSSTPMRAIGPYQTYVKSFQIIFLWLFFYTLLLKVGPSNPYLGISSLVSLLILSCGLLFCIMHDASHKAYSSNRLINKLTLNLTLGVLGGCSFSWHQEHVVRHHGNTNILGADPDVYASHVIRLHPEDKWHWWQRWQHYYAIPLYSFMWLHWFFNDLINAVFNTYKLNKKKLCLFWVQIFLGLIPHILLAIVLPYFAFKNIWIVGIGYMIFFMCLSFVMAMTFVLAHVSNRQTFYLPHENLNKDWALHQLETTTDFSVDNKFLSWILGGLNFQVEHHIFPAVCHLHYPEIQKIVKNYCEKKCIPYHEEKTLWSAICSHASHLKALSRPTHPVLEELEASLPPPA